MKEKELNKLKQLDRIEYLLRKQEIGEHDSYVTISFFNFMIMIIGWLFIVACLLYLMADKSTALFQKFPAVFLIFRWGIFICVILDIIIICLHYRKIKKLDKRFKK